MYETDERELFFSIRMIDIQLSKAKTIRIAFFAETLCFLLLLSSRFV